MTQDFAKAHRSAAEPAPAPPRWIWFFSGFVSGGFLAFLAALWFLVPVTTTTSPVAETPRPETQAKTQTEEMQWDFYEIFPKSVVPIVEEYTNSGEKVVLDNFQWVLQAGSFQDPNDADERRATLLLMGLNVSTTTVDMSGKTWHRVLVGPFESALERNRAQDTLAQAEIRSIAMKVPKT
jgi:cell division protein FtsN